MPGAESFALCGENNHPHRLIHANRVQFTL
jgi:hypothetical protein